ncbi:hypothetical protein N7508_002177 [Penicillium antarcticum]|uniref:uncharacterized protein n=1 Tax=Penicillium antarcticum TaxID=416450 RepID=UPI002388B7CA|nr:uncharacterized protein N7508_002177 [Penicillium antarcticum]KAJ5317669.1 hypothetical protein N7508_002177 [Penicillium antarcticum]
MLATRSSFCILALAAQLGQATFSLEYPTRTGFNINLLDSPPCGMFNPNFKTDNITNFHVNGDTIYVASFIETKGTWLFRATLDVTAARNWTSLRPVIYPNVMGPFCEPGVTVPSSWAGSKGVVGVVQHTGDTLNYQCAAVQFVAGMATTIPEYCVNTTGLTATYTSDVALSSIPATYNPTETATAYSSFTTSSGDNSQGSESLSNKNGAALILCRQSAVAYSLITLPFIVMFS